MSNLREEFEKLPEIADRLKEYEHLFKLSSNKYICECSYVENFINGSWYTFREQQKKIDAVLEFIDSDDLGHDARLGDFYRDIEELLK